MRDYRDSEILRQLIADGLGHDRAGTRRMGRKTRRSLAAAANKGAGVSDMRDGPQFTAANLGGQVEENSSGVRLVWDNPMAMRQTTRRRTGVVSLMVIDGGKA